MDETDGRWFRWIADNTRYLFWAVWGAFGTVFFGAVDVGGDALRVYMAMLTVMAAGETHFRNRIGAL